ncbi:MAG: NAD(P)/FAD-dependent oxidoreductase [Deltaproteobacteria bacterium]|nr:NAD(P)/FAD-dependent oxidoreductase [Deltaproteobacteria bacterium]
MRIAIIGAGAGGLATGVLLKRAGFQDFVILERNAGVGGTWYRNRYPGLVCDIAAPLYQFSFELNPEWSGPYPPQPELLAYFEHTAEKYGLLPHCRFEVAVEGAVWNEEDAFWNLTLDSGETLEAEVVVSAVGMFGELKFPEIEGLESFEGTSFHSAAWDHEHDLSGETVGVIGSAASAVQFVPEIVKHARQVHLFQRSANWVMPKADDPYSEEQREQLRSDPAARQAARDEIWNMLDPGGAGAFTAIHIQMAEVCRENMAVVEDPQIRAKLLPDYLWGGKRPLLSNHYYPAFNRPNLELVTEGVERITSTSIVTVDGKERPIDTLVLATGFETTKFASAVNFVGRGGIPISEAWSDGAIAYKGIVTSGFPNLFMLYGPNTNGDSLITTIEFEAEHAVRQIQRLVDEGLAWTDVKPEAMAAYNEKVQKDIAAVEPWQAGCTDYYRSPSGRIVTQWPGRMSELRTLLETGDLDDYEAAAR